MLKKQGDKGVYSIWGICPWRCKTKGVYCTLINMPFMKNSCTHLWNYRVLMKTICILYFMNRSQFNCNEMRAKLEPVRPRYLHLVYLEVDDKNQLYYILSNRRLNIWNIHICTVFYVLQNDIFLTKNMVKICLYKALDFINWVR